MTDETFGERLQQAENELMRAQHDVDRQLKIIHQLEAQGQDDASAQQKLETLLETLEAAQQQHKAAAQNTG